MKKRLELGLTRLEKVIENMTKFIKLTERYNGKAPEPIVLNCSFVKSIKRGDKGTDTMVYMTDSKYYFVCETIAEIWEMLNTDYNSPPIIMNAQQALEYYKQRDGV